MVQMRNHKHYVFFVSSSKTFCRISKHHARFLFQYRSTSFFWFIKEGYCCEISHYGNVYESSRRFINISRNKQNQNPYYVPPYMRGYESLLEFKEIILKARKMESATRDIRKKFQKIAASGLPIPSSSLLRKQRLA